MHCCSVALYNKRRVKVHVVQHTGTHPTYAHTLISLLPCQLLVCAFNPGVLFSVVHTTGSNLCVLYTTCFIIFIITTQCTLLQSTVLRSHVVCLSVCPSVTLVDCNHIGLKSWKLIAQTISPTPSLFVAKR